MHGVLLDLITCLSRSPDPSIMSSDIPTEELPRCEVKDCGALLRPDIVWFGEQLDANVLEKACTEFYLNITVHSACIRCKKAIQIEIE